MAETFLDLAPAPARNRVVDPERGFVLSREWERWYHRLHNWLLVKPSCHVAHSADQAITTSTWTILAFNTEQHDNAGMHDIVTDNDQVTIPLDGIYAVGFQLLWESNATGMRRADLTVDAVVAQPAPGEIISGDRRTALSGLSTLLSGSGTRELSAGAVLRLHVWQSSGGDLDVVSSGIQSPRFWCYRVSG